MKRSFFENEILLKAVKHYKNSCVNAQKEMLMSIGSDNTGNCNISDKVDSLDKEIRTCFVLITKLKYELRHKEKGE
jgi:hypothetical protein